MAQETIDEKPVKSTQSVKAKKAAQPVVAGTPVEPETKSPLQEPWFPWVLAAAALIIGIIGGFLGGVAVGERGDLRRGDDIPMFQGLDSERGGWHRGSTDDTSRGSFWQ
ncbi:hypothetical protein BGO18_01315 [Candidatus Saccharibacteria bacterium 47-87]|nr:hypothetical protein [Candidatus Saccharibacteria bacterium]OJU96807.1 MAG: hypothetical protein BGO18_01315 [Candidatus Saccharibacteria bacterium 47-87]